MGAPGSGRPHAPEIEARVSITYNYSPVLAEVLPGFTGLVDLFHGRRAGDVAVSYTHLTLPTSDLV